MCTVGFYYPYMYCKANLQLILWTVKQREFGTPKLRLFLVLILLIWMCNSGLVNEFLGFLLQAACFISW